MQFADEFCYEIYLGKIGEIKFPKKFSEIFSWKVPKKDDRNRARETH